MPTYEEWLNIVIVNWLEICQANYRLLRKDQRINLKLAQAINYRVPKNVIADITKTDRKLSSKFVEEALVKGDMEDAHHHYRLSPANIKRFLDEYKQRNPSVDVSAVGKLISKRSVGKRLVPTGATASAVSPILGTKISHEDPMLAKFTEFVQLWDCFVIQCGVNFANVDDVDLIGSTLVFRRGGQDVKVINAMTFEKTWKEYLALPSADASTPAPVAGSTNVEETVEEVEPTEEEEAEAEAETTR